MTPFPDRKYDVIYADPPWPVKMVKRKTRPNQVALSYQTLTLQEIVELPVRGLAADNAVLFLWTTHAFLPRSFSVMDAWGFRYQRTLTWDKGNGLCLFGFHHRTEFLLFGYKGKLDMYPRRAAISTIHAVKSWRQHSRKPDIFRDIAATFGLARLELFARQRTAGWDAWGDQLPPEWVS